MDRKLRRHDARGLTREFVVMKLGIAAVPNRVKVKHVMTAEVLFLRTSDSLREAWEILHAKCITGAPVVNGRGQLVGIVSKADLADPRHAPADSNTVKDVMTHVVYAVRAGDSIISAVKLMVDEDIHRAIVVNDDGSIAGIVTPMDILRVLLRAREAVEIAASQPPLEFVDLRELR
jgi:predicted transcriptional regulator